MNESNVFTKNVNREDRIVETFRSQYYCYDLEGVDKNMLLEERKQRNFDLIPLKLPVVLERISSTSDKVEVVDAITMRRLYKESKVPYAGVACKLKNGDIVPIRVISNTDDVESIIVERVRRYGYTSKVLTKYKMSKWIGNLDINLCIKVRTAFDYVRTVLKLYTTDCDDFKINVEACIEEPVNKEELTISIIGERFNNLDEYTRMKIILALGNLCSVSVIKINNIDVEQYINNLEITEELTETMIRDLFFFNEDVKVVQRVRGNELVRPIFNTLLKNKYDVSLMEKLYNSLEDKDMYIRISNSDKIKIKYLLDSKFKPDTYIKYVEDIDVNLVIKEHENK